MNLHEVHLPYCPIAFRARKKNLELYNKFIIVYHVFTISCAKKSKFKWNNWKLNRNWQLYSTRCTMYLFCLESCKFISNRTQL